MVYTYTRVIVIAMCVFLFFFLCFFFFFFFSWISLCMGKTSHMTPSHLHTWNRIRSNWLPSLVVHLVIFFFLLCLLNVFSMLSLLPLTNFPPLFPPHTVSFIRITSCYIDATAVAVSSFTQSLNSLALLLLLLLLLMLCTCVHKVNLHLSHCRSNPSHWFLLPCFSYFFFSFFFFSLFLRPSIVFVAM